MQESSETDISSKEIPHVTLVIIGSLKPLWNGTTFWLTLCISKSRKENPQKLTQLSSSPLKLTNRRAKLSEIFVLLKF